MTASEFWDVFGDYMNKLNLLIDSKIKYFNDTEKESNQFDNANNKSVLSKLAHLRIKRRTKY